MEIKVNKEIRSYTEKIIFGLSLRQFIFTVLAVLAAIGTFFLVKNFTSSMETISWFVIIAALPFVLFGFVTFHGLTFEQFLIVWVKDVVLSPRFLKISNDNRYYENAKKYIENARRIEFKNVSELPKEKTTKKKTVVKKDSSEKTENNSSQVSADYDENKSGPKIEPVSRSDNNSSQVLPNFEEAIKIVKPVVKADIESGYFPIAYVNETDEFVLDNFAITQLPISDTIDMYVNGTAKSIIDFTERKMRPLEQVEKAYETLLLKTIILYVRTELPSEKQSFDMICELIALQLQNKVELAGRMENVKNVFPHSRTLTYYTKFERAVGNGAETIYVNLLERLQLARKLRYRKSKRGDTNG